MARGFLYVHGEAEHNNHLSDGAVNEMAPKLKKAMPNVGCCIYDNKIVLLRYCPDASNDLPSNQNISGQAKIPSAMCSQSVTSALEGVQCAMEASSPDEMTLEEIAKKIAATDRR